MKILPFMAVQADCAYMSPRCLSIAGDNKKAGYVHPYIACKARQLIGWALEADKAQSRETGVPLGRIQSLEGVTAFINVQDLGV